MVEASIGRRIAALRRRRGLSQAAVAGLVGRSESWLSQVERGLRDVENFRVLRDLARVLRVDLDALTASSQPVPIRARDANESRVVAIEQALLLGSPATSTHPSGAVLTAHEAYQAARYDDVLDDLPDLIGALDASQSPEVLVQGYVVVAKLLTKIGCDDLAMVAADRARVAAARSADPADIGMANYQVVSALLPTPHAPLAVRLAVTTAARLEGDHDPEVISVSGALWLIAAVAAARAGDAEGAYGWLDRASRQADRLGGDANHRWTAFGHTNVAIHRLSVSVELGDASAALDAVRGIDVERLPPGLLSRRVQVHLDLAWAHAQRRRDADALVALLEVERRAPEVTRRNVLARDVIRRLLCRARGTSASAVRALADRAGVTV